MIKLLIGNTVLNVLSVFAPQSGLDDSIKDAFYDSLQLTVSGFTADETVLLCGDWNGHIGKTAVGYEGIHGGNGYGNRNEEGDKALDFAVANNFLICNTFFRKRDSHLITYHSGVTKTQIDFIMVRKDLFKSTKDVKAIPSETQTACV